MIEDEDMRPQDKFKHTEFDILPHIKAEYGGELKTLTEEQLDVDAQNDPVLREKLLNHIVPTVDTIVRYVDEMCIFILVYCHINNCELVSWSYALLLKVYEAPAWLCQVLH